MRAVSFRRLGWPAVITLVRILLLRRRAKRRVAKRIKRCFDGVPLDRYTFIVCGVKATTEDGCTKFYKADEIDTVIARVNALYAELMK